MTDSILDDDKDRMIRDIDMDEVYAEAERLGKDPSDVFLERIQRYKPYVWNNLSPNHLDWLQTDLYKFAEGLNPPPIEEPEWTGGGGVIEEIFKPVFKVVAGRETRVWTERERAFVEETTDVWKPEVIASKMDRTLSSIKREQAKIKLDIWAEKAIQEFEERERQKEIEYQENKAYYNA